MKKTILLLITTFIFFANSCKTDKKKEYKLTQMQEVMAIHDEVMPKMGTINKLIGELRTKIDSTEQGVQYNMAMTDLQEANKAMMDWMQGFGKLFDHEEILKGKELSTQKKLWLNEEDVKVKKLRDQINNSIERAEGLLKETPIQ